MKKILYAGVCALALSGLLPAFSAASASEQSVDGAEQVAVTINIVRIKSVLHLTQAQAAYWPPVESALRDIVRRQQSHDESAGFVRRISRGVVSVILDSAAIRRLATAARPLIARLSDEQKQAAGQLAQEMGLGSVVMAAMN